MRHFCWIGLGVLTLASPASAQEAADEESVDGVVEADSLQSEAVSRFPTPTLDPRITLLRDTLSPADTLLPKFTDLPELYTEAVLDPYTLDRPGSEPAWVLEGDQLMGRGGFSLLDVLESETMAIPQDLGGGGMPMFLGQPLGSQTNIDVFIDGVPVKDPLSVSWDLRRVSFEGIARIAWYPGAQSAAWGGGATGGVLSIITRRSLTPTARSMLAFTAGSFDVETFSGNFGRAVASGGDVFVAANFDATNGFLRLGDFTRNQFVARFGWEHGPHRFEISRVSDGFSGDANRTNVSGFQDQDSRTLHLAYLGRIAGLGVRAHAYGTTHDIGENFFYRDVLGLVGEGKRGGWRATVDWRGGPLLVWSEVVRESQEVDSQHTSFVRIDGSSVFESPDDDSTAGVIESPRDQSEWAGGIGWGSPDERVAVNGSARQFSYGDAAESGNAWQGEAIGRPLAGLTVRGAVGRGVRPPGMAEQALLQAFADDAIEIHPGAPARPEKLESWTTARGSARWERSGWRVEGRGFTARGRDAFLWLPATAWLYFDRGDLETVRLAESGFNTFDVVDLSISGVEGEIAGPLPWGLKGRFGARRLSATEDASGERVPYMPESQFLGQVRYAGRHFPSRDLLLEARVTGRFIGERTTLDPVETLSSFLAADLLVQATVINFTVFVSFKNIGGEAYRTEESFFLPGREGYFGINWRFHN